MMKRQTRVERMESGSYGLQQIGLGAVASIAGGLLGGLSNEGGSKDSETSGSSTPKWSDEQIPYLFGDQVNLPSTPQYTAQGLNYARGLTGGYNPAYGSQEPMSLEDLLAGVRGLSSSSGTDNPYYLDPTAQAQQGGVRGLLGYDRTGSPAMFTNSPYYGNQVANADMLQSPQGGYSSGWGQSGGAGGSDANGIGGGAAQGRLISNGMGFVVDVNGRELSLDEASTLMKAGLLEVEDMSNLGFGSAMVMNNSTDDLMGG